MRILEFRQLGTKLIRAAIARRRLRWEGVAITQKQADGFEPEPAFLVRDST